MQDARDNKLQELCRHYLAKLKSLAENHGLGGWLSDIIQANKNKTCSATEQEVELLSKMCDDERINRHDIPQLFGLSYRYCFENDLFDKIKKFQHTGIYSKVDAILFKTTFKRTKNTKQ